MENQVITEPTVGEVPAEQTGEANALDGVANELANAMRSGNDESAKELISTLSTDDVMKLYVGALQESIRRLEDEERKMSATVSDN